MEETMKLNTILSTALLGLGLVTTGAQARHHYHGPRMNVGFGFGVNVCRPVYRPYYAPVELRRASPVYATPCCHGHYRPVMAPVVYAPYVRPSFGVSFGSGPVNFGFGF